MKQSIFPKAGQWEHQNWLQLNLAVEMVVKFFQVKEHVAKQRIWSFFSPLLKGFVEISTHLEMQVATGEKHWYKSGCILEAKE